MRFKTGEKAEEFVTLEIVLVQPPFASSDVVHLCISCTCSCWPGRKPVSLWGAYPHALSAVVTNPKDPGRWIGADLPTNNSGKISAFYHMR